MNIAVSVTAAVVAVTVYFTKSFVYYLFNIFTQIKIHILLTTKHLYQNNAQVNQLKY